MIRLLAVVTFLVIVGVCSYVVLNPGSYSTLVLFPASVVLRVAILAVIVGLMRPSQKVPQDFESSRAER
jgi:hypothetical protein